MTTIEQASSKLKEISEVIDKAADDLGSTAAPDARLIQKVFRQMVNVERQMWQVKASIETLNSDPEIDYKLRFVLSSSRSSHTSIPNILSGLRTLAQLPENELMKSSYERNELLEKLREGMRSVSYELGGVQNLLSDSSWGLG